MNKNKYHRIYASKPLNGGNKMENQIKEKGQPPIKKIHKEGIDLSVWENKHGDKTFKTVVMKQSYKDKEGNWKTTNKFAMDKIPTLIQMLDTIYKEEITIKQ